MWLRASGVTNVVDFRAGTGTSTVDYMGEEDASQASVGIYDVLGRQVLKLHGGYLSSGDPHRFPINATGLSNGLYVVRIDGPGVNLSRKLLLIR